MSRNQSINLSVDLTKALLWQYNNSTALQALINQKNTWYQTNQVSFWNNWIANVFNISTATTFGLNVWGIIVGQSRNIAVGTSSGKFGVVGGYNAGSFNSAPFNFGGWNSSAYTPAIPYQLPDAIYRTLIIAKALINVSKNTIPALNAIIKLVFAGRGGIYYVDNHNMTITLQYNFNPTLIEFAIITQILSASRPAAVLLNFSGYTRSMTGGFNAGSFNSITYNYGGFSS